MGIFTRLHKIAESIKSRGMRFISKTLNISTENQDAGFNIVDATNELNKSGEFICRQFNQDNVEESWLIMRPELIIGKETMIQINVTTRYDSNEIIFVMPVYGDGSEGLTGDKIESFYNSITQFNSRTNGGYFTKYTYDKTHAPVFMHHLPLSKMDSKWFRETLIYFINIHIGFRPYFDNLITELGLKFKENAALEDPVRKYLRNPKFIAFEESPKHSQLVPISDNIPELGWSSWNSTSERDLTDTPK